MMEMYPVPRTKNSRQLKRNARTGFKRYVTAQKDIAKRLSGSKKMVYLDGRNADDIYS